MARSGPEYHDFELVHLAHAGLLVLAVLEHLGERGDILAFLQFWRKAGGILEDLVGHAQFFGNAGVVLVDNGSALAGKVVKEAVVLSLADLFLCDGLDDAERIALFSHWFPPRFSGGYAFSDVSCPLSSPAGRPRGFSIP